MKNLENFPSYITQSFSQFLAYCFVEPNRVLLEIKRIKPRKPKICKKCGEKIEKGVYDCISLKFGTIKGNLFNKFLHSECFKPTIEKLAEFVEQIESNILNYDDLKRGFISSEEFEMSIKNLEAEKTD